MLLLLQVHLSREEVLLAILRIFHGERNENGSAEICKKQSEIEL